MGVVPIPGNEYGILGQNYVALFLGSEMSAELHSTNLIFGIESYTIDSFLLIGNVLAKHICNSRRRYEIVSRLGTVYPSC